MSTTWSWIVIVGALGSLLFFFLLLHLNRRISHQPGETTGHDYDGIQEYDNPLPRWWYWMYVLTIVFSLGYLAWYPGLGNFAGYSGWTSEGEVTSDMDVSRAKYDAIYAAYIGTPVEELALDPSVAKMGQRLFANNCAACHGSAAAGGPGYPDLTDSVWIWGGSGAQIEQSILAGRQAMMPPWKGLIPDDAIDDVTAQVLSLGGASVDPLAVERGQATWSLYCIVCHGADGKGNQLLGAADLTDVASLYGNTPDAIKVTIRDGRSGQMPGFRDTLGESRVHVLAAYIYGLSNGQSR